MCRQSGYHAQAAHLAKRFGDTDAYLKIQLMDTHQPREALDALQKLASAQQQTFLLKYGRPFLDHLPEETVKTMIHLCTDATAFTVAEKAQMVEGTFLDIDDPSLKEEFTRPNSTHSSFNPIQLSPREIHPTLCQSSCAARHLSRSHG